MQKTAAGGWFLPLITSPVQALPASVVITFVAATLMVTSFSTALWLSHGQPSITQPTASGAGN